MAEKDAGAFRAQVFDDLARHKPLVRLARGLHGLLGRGSLSTAYVAAYGLKAYIAASLPRSTAPILAVAAYRNEARQLADLDRLLGPDRVAHADIRTLRLLDPRGWLASVGALLRGRGARRYLSLVRRVNQEDEASFLVACRVAATAAYYARFHRLLGAAPHARAVLVSSDSNPYAMGLAFAAMARGLRTIYVNHGHIPDGPPRLWFDLSLLDGPALADVYEESHGIAGQVVYKGSEGQRRPLSTGGLRRPRTVGIFMSLLVDWPRFARVLADIRRVLCPERIVLRLHPNPLVRDPDWREHVRDAPDLEVSYGEHVLTSDAARCDLVIAAGSSCHLTVLKYGVPTLALAGLDKVPHDFYRFHRRRIVPHYASADDIDLEALAAFYEDPDWSARFAEFDPGYLEPAGARDAAVKAAIEELLRTGVGGRNID